jgi:hypothetical protein
MVVTIYDPGEAPSDIEVRSDEVLVDLGGQPFRIRLEIATHLRAIIDEIVFSSRNF